MTDTELMDWLDWYTSTLVLTAAVSTETTRIATKRNHAGQLVFRLSVGTQEPTLRAAIESVAKQYPQPAR